jgi:hypothetical protein
LIDRCAISEARNSLFIPRDEHFDSEVEHAPIHQKLMIIESLDEIVSFFEQNEQIYPVMNYKNYDRSPRNPSVNHFDIHTRADLVFLFINYEGSEKFTRQFEQYMEGKMSLASANLSSDKISIKAININGDKISSSRLAEALESSNLRGIFLFDFDKLPNVGILNRIQNFRLFQNTLDTIEKGILGLQTTTQYLTLETIISKIRDEQEGNKQLMLGLFSQQVQTSIFDTEDLLDEFMEYLGDDFASILLPASKNPNQQNLWFEFAGFIETIQSFFTTDEYFLSAAQTAQEEIKSRIMGKIQHDTFDEKTAASASTIFLGAEKRRIISQPSNTEIIEFPMRGVHVTGFTQIDELIDAIEEDEEREYNSEECHKITDHIKNFIFSALHGINQLINLLNLEKNDDVLFKKFIFSTIMGMQKDLFTDETRTELSDADELQQKWVRFNATRESRIIGHDVYSREDRQSSESKFLRAAKHTIHHLGKDSGNGSSLIFKLLCPDMQINSGDILNKLITSLNDGSIIIPPIALNDVQSTLLVFDKGIHENLLKLYFQCREVTHAPALVEAMEVQPIYSFLFWSSERATLNRNKLQKTLEQLNAAVSHSECQQFTYGEVAAEVITAELSWFSDAGGVA